MKNLLEIKTTLVGIALLFLSFDYFQFGILTEAEHPSVVVFAGGLLAGLGFLFASDEIITAIKSLIKASVEALKKLLQKKSS